MVDDMKTNSLEHLLVEPTDEMLHHVNTENGLCKLRGVKFCANKKMPAGPYIINVKDVTQGLPDRMLMKPFKVLMKLVDLTEPEEKPEDKPPSKQPPQRGKKK